MVGNLFYIFIAVLSKKLIRIEAVAIKQVIMLRTMKHIFMFAILLGGFALVTLAQSQEGI